MEAHLFFLKQKPSASIGSSLVAGELHRQIYFLQKRLKAFRHALCGRLVQNIKKGLPNLSFINNIRLAILCQAPLP
ncbi:hypothetical protein COU37_02775 [Candidatus Micrarchaeota archaeon CG10_big_fil_rev_8_21_14_0_10_45_29]|nr:MAG: hypothetical protein COU37_02775 [Candidatus Micrarchaeota archaeon CG10_big_fil_rev_8_21_14_0_10_45_29]